MTRQDLFKMALTDIEDAVNDIFIKYQSRLGILDGGLDPILENEICDTEHDIADLIAKGLVYQLENGKGIR